LTAKVRYAQNFLPHKTQTNQTKSLLLDLTSESHYSDNRTFMRKAITVLAIIFLVLILVVGGLFWGLQTPAGQNFLTRQATSYLRKKLDTRLDIRSIRFDIPDWIVMEGVYVEDKTGDTLIAGERLYVNMDMLGLLKGTVGINSVELENIRLKVNRTLPDTTFNFQFIIDAFDSGEPTPVDTTSAPLEMRLNEIKLKRVHLTYKDAVLGTDADAVLPNARVLFSKFNPTLSQYHPASIVLNGARVDLRLYEATTTEELSTTVTRDPPDTLDVKLGVLDVRDLNFNFSDEVSGLTNGIQLGRLAGRVEHTYLGSQHVSIHDVLLENTTAFVEFSKQTNPDKTAKAKPEPSAIEAPGWTVLVGSLNLVNNKVRFDDFNEPRQPKGLDYAHLGIMDLTADLKDFVYSTDNITGRLEKGSFREQSGFELRRAQAVFGYTPTETYLRDMYIQTPSTILRNDLLLRYKSQEQLTDDPGKARINLKLDNSQLAYSDVLLLVPDLKDTPPFNKKPKGILKGDAFLTGTVDNLQVSKARFSTLDGTVVSATGRIRGLPDTEKLALDIKIAEMTTTREDLLQMVPDSMIPSSVELPEKLIVKGMVKGTLQNLTMDAQIETSLGNGTFAGNIKNATDTRTAAYKSQLSFDAFDMGKLLKQPAEQLGTLTLTTEVEGVGLDPATMEARLNGTVESASILGYEYNNLVLNGTVDKGLTDFAADLNDNNIDIKLRGKANISGEYPTMNATADITRLNLKNLNLYADPLGVQGRIVVNMTSTNPANPLGEIGIRNLVLNKNDTIARLDSVKVQFSTPDSTKLALIETSFLKARLSGNYDYAQLGDIVLTEVNKYFVTPDITYTPISTPYDLQLDARVANHPVIQLFTPALTQMDTVRLVARLDSRRDTTLSLSFAMPLLEYDSIHTDEAYVTMAGIDNIATFSGNIGKIETESFRVQKASLEGTVDESNALFNLMVRDSINAPRHRVAAGLTYADSAYRFSLRDQLLLDYKTWQTDPSGYIQYGAKGLLARQFGIQRQNQGITVNSLTDESNGPIGIMLDSVSIGQFVTLVTQDSTLVSGKMDGDIVLRNYMDTSMFAGDLFVKNLAVTQILIGDLDMHAINEKPNRITLDANLSSNLNDLSFGGDYITKGAEELNFNLTIRKLGAKTIEAFSFGELRKARGSISGQATIRGTADSPLLNGQMKFNDVAFDITQLSARYRLNGQSINFKGQELLFSKFIIEDSLNQKLEVNGSVSIATLPDVGYDLTIRANEFTVLNATRKDNDYFYGKGIIDAVLSIKGRGTESVIDGTIKLRSGSDITVLFPDDAEGAGSTEGIVKFIDVSDSTSSAQMAASDEIDTGLKIDYISEMSLNIEADDESQLTIILDELNGDNIKVRGNAQLNTGIAPNGQLYLLGLYELTEGSYDLTFEVLKKQFKIQKGSQILWTGDPMQAEVDITAVYTVDADLTAIGATETAFGKIPLDVKLKINGNLMSPVVTFDIVVSGRMNEDDAKKIEQSNVLSNLRNSTAELNKQVFALLVLNRFISEQSTGGSNSSLNAEAIARQSVSQLLSDQLNLLASDLIKGVNVNFNLNSTAEGTTARTDLSVGLSKAFLNDRLTVSVGRNFELENTGGSGEASTEIFDNVAVNYALTKDGRYLFRAYRKNQYQAVLQGFIVETGLSFIITLDYDYFRELFQKQLQ
jgi:hypothetical protein